MPLNDTTLRNLKAASKPYNKADGGGLRIVVNANGTKTWRLDYRFLGTRKTLTIGQYPTISLVDARAKREEAKKLLSQNLDPAVQKKVGQLITQQEHADTFDVVADEFLTKMESIGRAAPTLQKNRWMLKEVAKALGPRPMKQITSPEVFALLSAIEATGRRDTAIATRAAISRVFRLAILSGRADNDPTYALRGALQPAEVVSHPALLDPKAVGGLVRAVNTYTGWLSLRAALQMQAIAFARPSETRTMNIAEIDFDRRIWTIPKEKAKMRRPQDVPLSRQALVVIEGMRASINKDGDVFPSMMSGKRHLSENAMNSALRRMGFTSDEHTAHGFRSTASTLLNASKKFSPDAIEAQLAHLDKDTTRRIYNRGDYWEERVEMMQWWADYIDQLAADRS